MKSTDSTHNRLVSSGVFELPVRISMEMGDNFIAPQLIPIPFLVQIDGLAIASARQCACHIAPPFPSTWLCCLSGETPPPPFTRMDRVVDRHLLLVKVSETYSGDRHGNWEWHISEMGYVEFNRIRDGKDWMASKTATATATETAPAPAPGHNCGEREKEARHATQQRGKEEEANKLDLHHHFE